MLNFGNQKFKLDSVDSTNNFAAKLIQQGLCRNGAVVMADFQSHGKGQRGNVWLSKPSENLICSLIWLPDNMAVNLLPSLNWIVGVSLIEVLKKYGIQAMVKWPNDIICNNKKIAGVLIETELKGANVKSIVIGIGLNVNQLDFEEKRPTSMHLITGQYYNLTDILSTLCVQLNLWCSNLKNPLFILNKYNEVLFKRNQKAKFLVDNEPLLGQILQVNEEGKIEIKIGSEVKSFDFKEISMDF